jgi:hypothetical protein
MLLSFALLFLDLFEREVFFFEEEKDLIELLTEEWTLLDLDTIELFLTDFLVLDFLFGVFYIVALST